MRWRALSCVALLPFLLGGCVFAVGTGGRSDERRMESLERRLSRAEERLGIAPGAKEAR